MFWISQEQKQIQRGIEGILVVFDQECFNQLNNLFGMMNSSYFLRTYYVVKRSLAQKGFYTEKL